VSGDGGVVAYGQSPLLPDPAVSGDGGATPIELRTSLEVDGELPTSTVGPNPLDVVRATLVDVPLPSSTASVLDAYRDALRGVEDTDATP